jgi:hypothetical protein
MNLDQFTVWGIILGLIIYISIGMAMYSPILFGKVWQKYKGLRDKDLSGAGPALALSLVGGLVGIIVLYVFMDLLNYSTPVEGAISGLLISLFATAHSFNPVVYDKNTGLGNRVRVWLIDSFNMVIVFVLTGAVLGVFM